MLPRFSDITHYWCIIKKKFWSWFWMSLVTSRRLQITPSSHTSLSFSLSLSLSLSLLSIQSCHLELCWGFPVAIKSRIILPSSFAWNGRQIAIIMIECYLLDGLIAKSWVQFNWLYWQGIKLWMDSRPLQLHQKEIRIGLFKAWFRIDIYS